MIAKVAVAAANFAIDKPYSYFIPIGTSLCAGMRVSVPFGRGNRITEGVVLSVEDGDATGLKSVEQVLDEVPLLDPTMLHLAAFIRERYFCTFYDAARAMLPAGLWFHTNATYALTEDRSWQEKSLRNAAASSLLQLLQELGGQAKEDVLKQAISDEQVRQQALDYLLRKKWISCETDYRRKTSDKTEQIATLCVDPQEAMAFAATRPKSAAMQKSVLEMMCRVGSACVKDICYYTGATSATVRRLAQLGYLELSERAVLRCRQIQPVVPEGELQLNPEQTLAYEGLCAQMAQDAPGAALLYGVTGSGKTSVYIKLIDACLKKNKQAMLLVPEIALTPQLLGLMAGYFGDKVAVLHSSLSDAERYDQWKRLHSGQASLVVGTRSAVFAPCPDLGLIILDEEQEHSYKSENTPRYDAKEVALWRGIKEKAMVLFGSATPSVQTMYLAKTGHYRLYTLKERYNGRPLPKVDIVDMKAQLEQGNDLSLSYPMQDALGETAEKGQQAILFLNRRGNSRALVCVQCGQAPECPRCSARLTYHSANERVMCHYCGYAQPVQKQCDCGGQLKRIGTGTQKVQQELSCVFPDLPVLRMDADTVSAVNTHEKILERFCSEKVPVLLGTQMVAKGLNLPDVTLVGVLDADLSLYSGNFRAAETTFNMLTQVVGRAGRGQATGRAMIQTLVPQHKVITLAAAQNYDEFYNLEIGLRRVQLLPPFADLVSITFSGEDEGAVLRSAEKFRSSLATCLQLPEYEAGEYRLLGPAPCTVPKINYHFRYRISLRCKLNKKMRNLIAHLLRQFGTDRTNRTIAAFVDVNGLD